MKIWLDDIRDPICTPVSKLSDPKNWTWCKTAEEALAHIKTGSVTEISFDYDLGDTDYAHNGYWLAAKIEQMAAEGAIPTMSWRVHSASQIGADRIKAAMRSADKYWEKS